MVSSQTEGRRKFHLLQRVSGGLRWLFWKIGHFTFDFPLISISLPFLLCLGLSYGFFHATTESAWDKVYAPLSSRSKENAKAYENMFGAVPEELYVIILAREKGGLLSNSTFAEISRLDEAIRNTSVSVSVSSKIEGDGGEEDETRDGKREISFDDVCLLHKEGMCFDISVPKMFPPQSPLYGLPYNDQYPQITVPVHSVLPDRIYPNVLLGFSGAELVEAPPTADLYLTRRTLNGTRLKSLWDEGGSLGEIGENGTFISKANGAFHLYFLDSNRVGREASHKWQAQVLSMLESPEWTEHPEVIVQAYASRSIDDQLERTTGWTVSDLRNYGIIAVLLVVYAIAASWYWGCDLSRSLPFASTMGVFAPVLATAGSAGFLFLLRLPFTAPNLAVPFLVLGIGVDDVFVILSMLQAGEGKGRSSRGARTRVAEALRDGGPAILMTTATDLIGFAFGFMTPSFAIRNFCAFMIAGLVLGFFLVLTFFMGCLGVDTRREALEEKGYIGTVWRFLSSNPFRRLTAGAEILSEADGKEGGYQGERTVYSSERDQGGNGERESVNGHSRGHEGPTSASRKNSMPMGMDSEEEGGAGSRARSTSPEHPRTPPRTPDAVAATASHTPEAESETPSRPEEAPDLPIVQSDLLGGQQAAEKGGDTEEKGREMNRPEDRRETGPPAAAASVCLSPSSLNSASRPGRRSVPPPLDDISVRQRTYLSREVAHAANSGLISACLGSAGRLTPPKCAHLAGLEKGEEYLRPSVRPLEAEDAEEVHKRAGGKGGRWVVASVPGADCTEGPKGRFALRRESAISASRVANGFTHGFLTQFVQNFYGPALLSVPGRLVVLLTWLAYAGLAVWGICELNIGIRLNALSEPGSRFASFFLSYESHFERVGLPGWIWFDPGAEWWRPETQDSLMDWLKEVKETGSMSLVVPPMAIFLETEYLPSVERRGRDGEDGEMSGESEKEFFERRLREYLGGLGNAFENHFKWEDPKNKTGLVSWRAFCLSRHCSDSACVTENLLDVRELEGRSPFFSARVHVLQFILAESDLQIVQSTLVTMAGVLLAAALATVLLLRRLPDTLFVLLCVAAVQVGVVGFMSLWGLSLSILTQVILIICAGISVDYVAHVCHAINHAIGETALERALEGLSSLGPPVFHGAVTVVLAALPAWFSSSPVFLIFFKTVTLAIVFAFWHGVAILPVAMATFGGDLCACRDMKREKETEREGCCKRGGKGKKEWCLSCRDVRLRDSAVGALVSSFENGEEGQSAEQPHVHQVVKLPDSKSMSQETA
uniref:SSD domain-containing protein n=1 Tax=Chromera velia CCMP2878 TaxID=1169474 RepID=A0A0G4GU06_9ALVE|eukprot:Cvel_23370.t1-p1 / transcript=Cvel_23370.t1 / gene=Cvel_23370 / organism=Chromera_velia_CCMP2878 / gene_product=Patched domain-containing protein 3, putative / transcript_product=Patched domain-containing protein 3, putative / location=Cvel_scaffold2400:12681-17790(-) / protein_length=1284 / sequence_SO=supercontig / SO=protein_coding / is_pseudo=false